MPKLYPVLAEEYRLNQVRSFQKELVAEVNKRQRLLRRNKKLRWSLARTSEALRVTAAGLGTASIALLVSGIGAPASVPTAAVGVILGGVDFFPSLAVRRLEKKTCRHMKLEVLANSKLLAISRLLSKGLADGSLSDDEFQGFTDEKGAYLQAKGEIDKSAEAQLKQLAAEFEKRLERFRN